MKHAVRRRTDPAEERARILEVAEEHFRRAGYRKTSVTDIAVELGMGPANIYRFFPSKDAIKEAVCMRVMDQVVDIAVAAARTRAPALEKLNRLVTAIHRHNKTKLIQDRIHRGEDTDADLREQIRFIGKALGKSAARSD